MTLKEDQHWIEVLYVEDDPGDVELTSEALQEAKVRVNLTVVEDGDKALDYLHQKPPYAGVGQPDLILLDLNLPKKSGRQVLAEIKSDQKLRHIPVVILTTSDDHEDMIKTHQLGANCYIRKPVGLEGFSRVVRSIEEFWFTIVRVPNQ